MSDLASSPQKSYVFGSYRLDLPLAALIGPDGAVIPLRPKVFDMLRLLIENANRVVSRDELMRTIWHGVTVNEDGITQCIRELRVCLGDAAQHIIKTVPKRGYVFVAKLEVASASNLESGSLVNDKKDDLLANTVERIPRLSLVILPFINSSGDAAQDYLSDALTDELTSELARLDGVFIISRSSAQSYRDKPKDPRTIGRELNVRYVVQGISRRLNSGSLRMHINLISTQTGEILFRHQCDQPLDLLEKSNAFVVRKIASILGSGLLDVELRRGSERSSDPDAIDLMMRASSLMQHAAGVVQVQQAEALLEQAIALDPGNISAKIQLAYCLMSQIDGYGACRPTNMPRALGLASEVEGVRPNSIGCIALRGAMLLWQGRYSEGEIAYQRVLEMDPNFEGAHHQLGAIKLWTGRAEEAVPFYAEALRRDPISASYWFRCYVLGMAYLQACQPPEAVTWLLRSVVENPGRDGMSSLFSRIYLTSAYAWCGRLEDAKRELEEVKKLSPLITAYSFDMRQWQNSKLSERLSYVSEGLAIAGLRKVADENDSPLNDEWPILGKVAVGLTQAGVPGGRVVKTREFTTMLTSDDLLVLDVNLIGMSVPGAIAILSDFVGGSLDDELQSKLASQIEKLTGETGKERPIAILGWNAERWSARNLAVRLIALGYKRIHWYRGGKEAWVGAGNKLSRVGKQAQL